jgi:hypothetical protein
LIAKLRFDRLNLGLCYNCKEATSVDTSQQDFRQRHADAANAHRA